MDKKYNPAVAEKRWQQYWEEVELFKFDPGAPADILAATRAAAVTFRTGEELAAEVKS